MKAQKTGGWALIVMLCLTVIYILIILPLGKQYGLNESGATLDPAKMLALYSGSTATVRALMPFGVLLGILYLLIALGVKARMQAKAPNLMRLLIIVASVAAALRLANSMIGLRGLESMAKAPDVSVYRPLLAALNGLSTAAEHAWGWAVLLIALGALATALLPRLLGYILLVCGIVSIIGFMLPSATGTAATVTLIIVLALNVISILWLAVLLIRKPEPGLA